MIRTVALALAACTLLAAPAAGARERLTGEQKLAKMLEGRVAGKPQSCLSSLRSRSMQIIEETALVYDSGRTIWVNVPRNPDSLDWGDALLTRQWGSQLCKQDIVTTFDTSSGFYTGNVFLGDFVPYTRVD